MYVHEHVTVSLLIPIQILSNITCHVRFAIIQIDIALCAAHLAWKEDEKKRREEHIQKVLMKAREDHQKHLAVVLKEREKEWIVKYNKTNSADGLSRRKCNRVDVYVTIYS